MEVVATNSIIVSYFIAAGIAIVIVIVIAAVGIAITTLIVAYEY